MIYTLEVLKSFNDKNNKNSYIPGQEISVEEERAFELLSNPHQIVRFVSRISAGNDKEKIISADEKKKIVDEYLENEEIDEIICSLNDEIKNRIIEEYLSLQKDTNEEDENLDKSTPVEQTEDYAKELSSKHFKELQEIASSKEIDTTGLNTKEKLIEAILNK